MNAKPGKTRPAACAGVVLGLLLTGLALMLAACGGEAPLQIMDESGEPWIARGSHCVRESVEGPLRRVINRTDPELCGLEFKHRPPAYVRVVPPPGMVSP